MTKKTLQLTVRRVLNGWIVDEFENNVIPSRTAVFSNRRDLGRFLDQWVVAVENETALADDEVFKDD